MEAMEKLMAHVRERPIELRNLKQKGAKIVGYVPNGYMPEDLVHACGALPVGLIRGGDHEPVTASERCLFRLLDTFCRAQIGYRVLGEELIYQLPDLLVVPITDRNITAIADSWELYTDVEVFKFGVPRYVGVDHGLEYYVEGLKLLKEKLELLTGVEIEHERLKEEIELSNKIGILLKEISRTRISDPPVISGKDFIKINHAAYRADRKVLLSALEDISSALKGENAPEPKGARIMLVGSTIAEGDYKVLDMLEEADACVVIEEFSEGVRPDQNIIQTDGDLIRSMARGYLNGRVPPAMFHGVIKKRFDYLLKLAREFRVDGVVWYSMMYRDAYDREGLLFSEFLKKEMGIPMLKISSGYDIAETGPMRTRIETFIEIIKQGR
ncbi:MAG: 2-hydroxyacyl-CoA dehydratase [Deltaproteobacteria bacterium]|nr:2-hydroxyacyl-CoA dehydratase [Deltaproteobacteria bacterium]